MGALTSTTIIGLSTLPRSIYTPLMITTMLTTRNHISLFTFLLILISIIHALPTNTRTSAKVIPLSKRTDPYFPPDPPSCPKCQAEYGNIQHCAVAAPVLANFSMVIFNPGAFIDVIQCACTETFQAVFPQCADCFIKTNQTEVLNCSTEDLTGALKGVRNVCAVASTILGNVTAGNSEPSSTPTPDPNSALQRIWRMHSLAFAVAITTTLALA